MLLRLPGELLDAVLVNTTVGSRAHLAAVCRPLRGAVREFEAQTPAARLDALRGSQEVFWDLFGFVNRAPRPHDAARSFDVHRADTGVAFDTREPGLGDMGQWTVEMKFLPPAATSVEAEWLTTAPNDPRRPRKKYWEGLRSVSVDGVRFYMDLDREQFSLAHIPIFTRTPSRVVAAAELLRAWYLPGGHVQIRRTSYTVDDADPDGDNDFLLPFKLELAAMVPALVDSGLFACVP